MSRPRAFILMYHRVAELQPDEWKLCISPALFREHMLEIKRSAYPMPLSDLAVALARGDVPPAAVVVTFDDGCLDNLTTASPILEDLGLPATFFIPTERLDEPHEFWWDTLERAFSAPELPELLDLTAETGETYRAGRADERTASHRKVAERVRRLDWRERDQLMLEIAGWAGIDTSPRSTHRPMLAEEVRTLAARPAHDIGAHSVHHLALPALPMERRRDEMRGSQALLEGLVGSPVTAFAYPYGQVDPDTMVIAAEFFSVAVAVEGACVSGASDRRALPRVDGNLLSTSQLADLLVQIG